MHKTLLSVLVLGLVIIGGGIASQFPLLPEGGDHTQVASISPAPYTFTRTGELV